MGWTRIGRPTAVILAALLLGGLVFRTSFPAAVRDSDPVLALNINGSDARAQANMAAAMVSPTADAAQLQKASELARAALLADPTLVIAARTFGLASAAQGDAPRARRLLSYSEQLSRRDLPTQLWFIEDAVQRNDVKAALHHFDIALRSSVTSHKLLLPVLVNATEDPQLVVPIANLLRGAPAWGPEFIHLLVTQGKATANIDRLLLYLARNGRMPSRFATDDFIRRLVAEGDYARAWDLYQRTVTHADPPLLRDTSFSGPDANLPFEWLTANAPERTANKNATDAGGLSFSLIAGSSGEIARQLLFLRPGHYVLSGKVEQFRPSGADQLTWDLTCADSGKVLAQIPLPAAPESTAAYRMAFEVPGSSCAAQRLALNGRSDQGTSDLSGVVPSVSLARVE